MEWEQGYRKGVVTSDIIAILLVTSVSAAVATTGSFGMHPWFALLGGATMLCALPARRAWNVNVLGEGVEEYRRLGLGMFTAAVIVALVAPMFVGLDARPLVLGVIPLTAALTLVSRYLLRRGLHRSRRDGRCMLPVVAAGGRDSILDLIERTRTSTHVGWKVEAACVVTPDTPRDVAGEIAGVPVVGGLDELAELVRRNGYRVVAVTPDQYWTPQRVQRLSWDLEGTSAELVVAPVLMQVGGPRLGVSGVLGMPLLRVTLPTFTGWSRAVKEVVDRIGSAILLAVTAPLLLLTALAIRLTSRGPVFYSQLRVKRDGEPFRIWKFRTMGTNADGELPTLADANNSDGPLFKIHADPRVTPVGRVLRRFSIDELPQLFNVFTGSMSLVGPRPPLPAETRTYGPDVGRRLLVKPGMTGLWQVSGRSDLSWEESVQLDLRYVEDWSLTLDAVILWKTVRAVLTGKGAY